MYTSALCALQISHVSCVRNDMLKICLMINFLFLCFPRERLVKAMVILNKISTAMQEGEYDANMPQDKVGRVVMVMVM